MAVTSHHRCRIDDHSHHTRFPICDIFLVPIRVNKQLALRQSLPQTILHTYTFCYSVDMAMLYLSIIAFMVVMINSLIYATKFILDKTNLTYFHAVFLLTYIAVGVVMFVKK